MQEMDRERVSQQPKKAIQSLRLRLHSGLRQSGTGLWPAIYGMAEAMPLTKQRHSKLFAQSNSIHEQFDDSFVVGLCQP
jgi:hypothetical protein